MNRIEYLEKLSNALKRKNVKDIDDILTDYDAHFRHEMSLGKTEEEIATKLLDPETIALEFASIESNEAAKFQKVILGVGLGFIDIIAIMVIILLISLVIVLGAFALSLLTIGLALLLNINISIIIPYIPYYGKLLLGLSLVFLSILSTIGTYYSYIYIKQWIKAFFRWHKNILANGIYPKLSLIPEIKNQNLSLKLITMISLVSFGVFFIVGYIVLMISAGSLEFWHEWNWFQ